MKINYSFLLIIIILTGCTQNTIGSVEKPKTHNAYSNVLSSQIQPYEITSLENFMQEEACGGFYNTKTKSCDDKASSNIINLTKLNTKFDLTKRPIENNGLNINSIQLESIEYSTQDHNVSGIIMMPNGIASNKIKGVILYFHPTIFDKASVPSMKTKGEADQYYAAIYASQGYIVVAPDYIGMGKDYKNIHPYILMPTYNTTDGADLLNVAYEIINAKYKQGKYKLFTVGYSEGGAYSVWFNKEYASKKYSFLENKYNLIASIGIDGAYDLSYTSFDFLTQDANIKNFKGQYQYITNLVKPSLITLAMATYNKYLPTAIRQNFNTGFFDMTKCYPTFAFNCSFNGLNHMSLEQALGQPSINNNNFPQTIFLDAIDRSLTYKDQKYTYEKPLNVLSDKNSAYSLYSGELLNSYMFRFILNKADIYWYQPKIPVRLISLKLDSVVSPMNMDNFTDSENLTKQRIDNQDFYTKNPFYNSTGERWIFGDEANYLDHIKAEPFLNIAALDYIEKINASLNK